MKRFKNVFFMAVMAVVALSFAACNNRPDDSAAKVTADSLAAVKASENAVCYESRATTKNTITSNYEIIIFCDPEGKKWPRNTKSDGVTPDTVTLHRQKGTVEWSFSRHGATQDSLEYITVVLEKREGEALNGKKGAGDNKSASQNSAAPPKPVDTTTASAVVSKSPTTKEGGSKDGSRSPSPPKKNTGVMTAVKK